MHRTLRHTPLRLLLAAALAALALTAACSMTQRPEPEYRQRADAMDAPALYRERLELVDELRAIDDERGIPADDMGDQALLDRRDEIQARLSYVDGLLERGEYAVHDLRYKVRATLRTPSPSAKNEQADQAQGQPAPPVGDPPDAPGTQSAPDNAPPETGPEAAEAPAAPGGAAPADALPRPSARTTGDAAAPAAQAAATVTAVRAVSDGGALIVRIDVSGDTAPRCRTFSLSSPQRHVVDVLGMAAPPASLPARLPVDSPAARRIRIGWHPENGSVRVVIDLAPGAEPGPLATDQHGAAVVVRH